MKINALMVPKPITISDNASIGEAIELMKINSIRHLPVISKDKKLKGFVTLADLKQSLIPSMVGDLTLHDIMLTKIAFQFNSCGPTIGLSPPLQHHRPPIIGPALCRQLPG